MRSPMGVPGPTRVSSLFFSSVSMCAVSSRSGPGAERRARSSAGGGAVQRLVFGPLGSHVVHAARGPDPVELFAGARLQALARDRAQRGDVLAAQRVEQVPVELRVDDEMREAAGSDD